jgi:hypothetical protein
MGFWINAAQVDELSLFQNICLDYPATYGRIYTTGGLVFKIISGEV